MLTQQKTTTWTRDSAPATPAPDLVRVKATLACAWCARETYSVQGEMVRSTGQFLVRQLLPGQRTGASGRLVCAHCGGPLFVSEWELDTPRKPLDAAAVGPARPGRPRRSVA